MNTKCRTCRIFAAIALIMMISISMAEKYLVIPTASQTATTCDGPDEVVSGGGRCWKDRNLGATRVAKSEDDDEAYGDLYQWGRLGDGHQNRYKDRVSTVIDIQNANDVPGHGYFIKGDSVNLDWRNPSKDILWQGIGGINNPCPQDFRVPTADEWKTEINSWGSPDIIGGGESPLKLVFAGIRGGYGTVQSEAVYGYYWSSTASFSLSQYMRVTSNAASANDLSANRALGMSVRCIKE